MFFNSLLIAQVTNPALSGGLGHGWDYVNTIIPRVLNIVYIIAVVIFVFIFIVGAFQWITAGGDKGKLAEARGKITHAIVGLLILLFIFVISRLVYLVLGVDIANFGSADGGTPAPTSVVSVYRDCTDNCSGSTVGYCIPDGTAPPSLACSDSNTDCFDPRANCFCCPVTPSPVAYRDCSVLCSGSAFSTTPVGYCVPGNNPPAPFPGCVNAGRDCTNPLQDCYCCPQPTVTPIPLPSATPTNSPNIGICADQTNGTCACICAPGYQSLSNQCSGSTPACISTNCQCSAYNFPNELLLNYRLNEGLGTTVADSSGNGYNSSLPDSGDVWVSSGPCFSNSVDFNGLNESVLRVPSTYGGIFHSPSFTLSAWVYPQPSGTNSRDIIIDNNSTVVMSLDTPLIINAGYNYSFFRPNVHVDNWSTTTCNPSSGGWSLTSTVNYPTQVWHHIVFTYDSVARIGRLYVNGQEVATRNNISMPQYPQCPSSAWSCPVGVARNCYATLTDDFAGYLQDTRIYNYALTQTQISSLFSSCTGGLGGPAALPTITNTPAPTRVPLPPVTPTSTPTPTRTPTSTPTPTRVPTATPTRIPTPLPTSTPVPTTTPSPTPTVVAFCTDTDGGINYATYGFVNSVNSSGVFYSASDNCTSSTLLSENYCVSTLPSSQTYDCGNASDPSVSYGCDAGRCCRLAGSSCSINEDCCGGNICNSGRCQAAVNIILNEALGISCHELCWQRGFRNGNYCQSIGTNSTADNGMTYVDSCSLTNVYGCDHGILSSVSSPLCNGHATNWTYCNCVPNPVSTVCNGGYGCTTNQECDYMAGAVCAFDSVSGTNCCQ